MTNWRRVRDFPLYEVSDDGQVRSFARTASGEPKALKPSERPDGYLQVKLQGGAIKTVTVHKLVFDAFGGAYTGEINHRDGNKKNNSIDNLEVMSRAENMRHSWAIGLRSHVGTKHPKAKFTDDDIREIRAARSAGKTLTEIAQSFGVHMTAISKIARRETWAHVADRSAEGRVPANNQ
jgi:hypothetical protein